MAAPTVAAQQDYTVSNGNPDPIITAQNGTSNLTVTNGEASSAPVTVVVTGSNTTTSITIEPGDSGQIGVDHGDNVTIHPKEGEIGTASGTWENTFVQI